MTALRSLDRHAPLHAQRTCLPPWPLAGHGDQRRAGDILGRAFADLATVPFRNLGADLIVQRSATTSAVPKEMGIILPYSAELMTGARAALALSVTLVFGNLVERRRELAILRVVGWKQRQVRREIAVEMALQGLFGGILALALVAVGSDLFSQITIALPANLPGENPATFAAGGFQAGASSIALPVSLTVWDWLPGPFLAAFALGVCGWWMAADRKAQSLWSAIKAV
ncbi:MAG: ABC transporter permease [Rhodomicrobiaceae bacterium]